ncbi:MAG: hypothetical protein ACLR6B_06955 [Blautia sp.]
MQRTVPLCQLSASGRKIFKPAQPGDNILMASSNTDYVFGRKMDRTKITAIYFRNKRKHRRSCLGRIGKTERQHYGLDRGKRDGFKDLYLAANGNILANKDCSSLFKEYRNLKSS